MVLNRMAEGISHARNAAYSNVLIGRVVGLRTPRDADGRPLPARWNVEVTNRRGVRYVLRDLLSAIPVQVGHEVVCVLRDGDITKGGYITGYARQPEPQNFIRHNAPGFATGFFNDANPWNVGILGSGASRTAEYDPSLIGPRGFIQIRDPDGDVIRTSPSFDTTHPFYGILLEEGVTSVQVEVTSLNAVTVEAVLPTGETIQVPLNSRTTVDLIHDGRRGESFEVKVTSGGSSQTYYFYIAEGTDPGLFAGINEVVASLIRAGDVVVVAGGELTDENEIPDGRYIRQFDTPLPIKVTQPRMTFLCEWIVTEVNGSVISSHATGGAAFFAGGGVGSEIVPRGYLEWRMWVILRFPDDDRVIGRTAFHTFPATMVPVSGEIQSRSLGLSIGSVGVTANISATRSESTYHRIGHSWDVEFDVADHLGETAEVELYIQNRYPIPRHWPFTIGDFRTSDSWIYQMREVGLGSNLLRTADPNG